MSNIYEDLFKKYPRLDVLREYEQTHLLKYFDKMSKEDKDGFINQLNMIDMSVISSSSEDEAGKECIIEPIPVLKIQQIEKQLDEFRAIGLETIREGKVGCVLLAGGMGTRLGFDGPKGMYDVGINKPVYIFERQIENLLEVVRQADKWIHLYIMTSDKNHEDTVNFFKEHNYFNYNSEYISFFMQDMAPATDFSGKIMMESNTLIAMSPNGNGGWYSSMMRCGLGNHIKENGIEYLNVYAVDNVLQRMADPVFVGATVKGEYASASKVVKKAAPDEKVGVMCLENGQPSVIEYYDMTDELRDKVDENGESVYNYGVILNYLFKLSEVQKIAGEKLPVHVVRKKIPYSSNTGRTIKPDETNGFKYETLVLDMVKICGKCLPFEVIREKEFAPIKNADGVDSVETARELMTKNGIEL